MPHGIDPNSLAVYFAALIHPVVAADAAAKILVSWYIVGVPLAMVVMCRAFGRSEWLAFFSCPMVFNSIFNVGFLNYLIGLPFVFFAVAISRTYAISGGWRRGFLLAATFCALFFSHAFAFLVGWSIAFVVLVISSRRFHRLLPAAAPLPLFTSWYWRKFVLLESTEQGVTFGTKEGFGFVFKTLDERFADIHVWGMRFFRDGTEEKVFIVLTLCWLAMMATGRHGSSVEFGQGGGWVSLLRRYLLEIVTLCCIVAYFVLPSHMHQLELIAERVVVIIAFFLCIWPRIDLRSSLPRLVMAPVVAVSLIFPVQVREHFERFEREVLGNLPRAIENLPDRTRMSYVMWQRGEDPVTWQGPLWHLPKAIHAVRNGGITDDSFAVRPYSAVAYRKGKTPHRLWGEFWRNPHLGDYDYVLLHSTTGAGEALQRPEVKLVFGESPWWLFRVERAAPPHSGE